MCNKENNLNSVLDSFQGVTEIKDEKEKLSHLSSQFEAIAKDVLLGGCFEINGVRRIYPLEIEFYYHEEGENGLKDPVMYHTADHDGKMLDYYPLGSLNCHISGMDVTFENQEKQYRASFLIRKYRVCEYESGEWVEKKECEKRSTYIYEDMFMNIKPGEGVKLVPPVKAERYATDQFTTGAVVGDYLALGVDGKFAKSESATRFVYRGTKKIDRHELHVIEVID